MLNIKKTEIKKKKVKIIAFLKITAFLLLYKIKAALFKKFRLPLITSFKITQKCNLKCLHCPFWKINTQKIKTQKLNGGQNLDFSKVTQILNRLKKDGIKIIIFEGGEPLLWKDLKNNKDINDVIKYSKKLFFITGVTTNGTIDLSNYDPDIFFVSIDGLKDTHDKIRGKSFDKILENIEANKNKKIIVNICISKINIDKFEDLIKFLNDKVYGITVQFFYPFENLPNLTLSQNEKEDVINKLLELKKQNLKLLNSSAALTKMKNNSWKCLDFLVASVEFDGSISYGCYLKNKVKNISCKDCGFSVHCEISLAYSLNLDAICNAKKIFL